MTHVITFASPKGGVGKSTNAVNLAVDLHGRGHGVVLIDTDLAQLSVAAWGGQPLRAGLTRPSVMSMPPEDLPRRLPAITEEFCVVDVAGKLSPDFLTVVAASDMVVAPVQPSAPDIWSLDRGLTAINRHMSKLRRGVVIVLMLTLVDQRVRITEEARVALKGLAERHGASCLIKAHTCHRVAYREAFAAGEGVTTFAEGSKAAAEVCAITDRLVARCKEAS